ncbi:Rv0909 family putative TA system antitoxin [Paludisphaera mucosa]|uniref:Rv0909 family putative TA system antitoxin n=1 Tax=Paludisphaera mucosa TaxID=3030827 RepID=A0ABT6FKR7_9BACT|nr:Rv0909 family putative TA system antitoxin [Paludisphaera mucosa]MDG3008172.1 Rv0909 family putative TA system antitoxin [Paludisphaera mucosa]
MKTQIAKLAPLALLFGSLLVVGAGCETKGPAEKAGEKIDRGVENAKDAIDPRGPGEKAGAAVDKAVNP